jgi:uncharacterized membrane-anchored protein YhcB (DUF1043 family)
MNKQKKLKSQLNSTQFEMDKRFKELEKKFNAETVRKTKKNAKEI